MITQPNIEWLQENIDTWIRHKVGNFKYLDDAEAKRYQSIAKEIDKERHFSIYACDACIRDLVNFVFNNYEKQINGQSSEVQTSKKSNEGITASHEKRTDSKPRKGNEKDV
jgi:hypothetical protein